MGNWLGLPINASDHGDKVDQIINYMHVLMFLIFIGWGAFFIYTLIRFRKKKNPVADYDGVKKHTSTYVEAAIVVAEIVFLVGFSIPFWAAEVDAFPDPEMDPFEVRVLGMQFAWVSHYPGPDKVFGKTSPDLVDDEEENYIGLDASDPAAADDIVTYGELMLPKGRQALIHLTTRDVIHSFSLPEFRVKQDAIPGMSIPVNFTPIMTTEEFREKIGNEERVFQIACAQLCGNLHYFMRGTLTIETPEVVAEWIESEAGNLDL